MPFGNEAALGYTGKANFKRQDTMNPTKQKRHKPFKDGNRLALPREMVDEGYNHFFYLADVPALDTAQFHPIVRDALAFARDRKLPPLEIEALGLHTQLGSEDTIAAANSIRQSLGFSPSKYDTDVVLCQAALPHEDAMFAGSAFVSVVLHTGEAPYVMTTFHANVQKDEDTGKPFYAMTSQSRTLKVGDVVVFDPTTPHCAVPSKSNDEAYLVMLQMQVPLRGAKDIKALLKQLPRRWNAAQRQDRY